MLSIYSIRKCFPYYCVAEEPYRRLIFLCSIALLAIETIRTRSRGKMGTEVLRKFLKSQVNDYADV